MCDTRARGAWAACCFIHTRAHRRARTLATTPLSRTAQPHRPPAAAHLRCAEEAVGLGVHREPRDAASVAAKVLHKVRAAAGVERQVADHILLQLRGREAGSTATRTACMRCSNAPGVPATAARALHALLMTRCCLPRCLLLCSPIQRPAGRTLLDENSTWSGACVHTTFCAPYFWLGTLCRKRPSAVL